MSCFLNHKVYDKILHPRINLILGNYILSVVKKQKIKCCKWGSVQYQIYLRDNFCIIVTKTLKVKPNTVSLVPASNKKIPEPSNFQ